MTTSNQFSSPLRFPKLASPYSIHYNFNERFQQYIFSLRHEDSFTQPLRHLVQICSTINNMSDAASTIFVPSRSPSPNNKCAGSTPYVVSSPPPDSPTESEAAWPHQQMVEHIACIFNIAEDEVREQFPTNRSLLPIDVPPPCASSPVFVPPAPSSPFIPGSPIGPYPRSEFDRYVDPIYPDSPPSIPSSTSSIDPSTLVIFADGEQYENKDAWNNRVVQGPQLHRSSPRLPLADITPIHQTSLSPIDTTDYKELAMVLYRQVSDQDEKIATLEADKENQAPPLMDPQPSVHPGTGWQDNFDATGTRHLFVIPLGDEDVIAPFIRYDLHNPFPKLLAMNGRYCTIHSRPLHAVPLTDRCALLSPRNKLFFHPDLELTRGVDWAVLYEDDPTLAGEVQHFRSHKKACNRLTQRMGQLRESLEVERQALYRSLARLTGANAIGCLQRHIDSSLHIAPSFSKAQVRKIRTSVKNRVTEARVRMPCECMWYGKEGHTIDDCFCIGLCRHCSRRGHTGVDCKDLHVMCLDNGDCKVYPTHPNFERGYCAAVDNCVDV